MICPICNQEHEINIQREEKELEGKTRNYKIGLVYHECPNMKQKQISYNFIIEPGENLEEVARQYLKDFGASLLEL